ncbi:MAG: hypothetical protein U0166_10215 [Acidobacteriota bacterium]
MARGRTPPSLLGPTRIAIPHETPSFASSLEDIRAGLASDAMTQVRVGATRTLALLADTYRVPALQVSVFDRPRPSLRGRRFSGELHGDYTPPGKIRIWARTAKKGQRVAFLTFLDTLLHEFLHHYDLTYLKLRDTVHSENFYKRLGSLCAMVKRELPKPAPDPAIAPFREALSFTEVREAIATQRPEAPLRPPEKRPRPADPVQPLLPF